MVGCVHLSRPMYAQANMGHPSSFLQALLRAAYLLADIAFGLVGLWVMLVKVAAPARAMERIRPGKMPRIKVADTVSNKAMVSEPFSRGTNCTGASSAGLP